MTPLNGDYVRVAVVRCLGGAVAESAATIPLGAHRDERTERLATALAQALSMLPPEEAIRVLDLATAELHLPPAAAPAEAKKPRPKKKAAEDLYAAVT